MHFVKEEGGGDPVAPAAGKWKTTKVWTDEGGRERRRKGCEGKRVREILTMASDRRAEARLPNKCLKGMRFDYPTRTALLD